MRYLSLVFLVAVSSVFLMGGYGMCKNFEARTDMYKKGEVAVGFKKGVIKKDAEAVFKKYGLNNYQGDASINFGKRFFYESGEKYIVYVPKGEEIIWSQRLSKESEVYRAGSHPDYDKVQLD